MSPAIIAALVQALITIGPGALQALEVLIKTMHDQPVSEADHAILGKALAQAVQQSYPA